MHPTMLCVLSDRRFHKLLLRFDQDLAAAVRVARCVSCGAVHHAASYRRKPRGIPVELDEEHRRRLSFCCAREGCRKRATPPSLRFLGRKVYVSACVVLISALRCGPTPARMVQLREQVGISARTVLRWRQWWRHIFVESCFWRAAASAFLPPIERADLPVSLLRRFAGEAQQPLIACLRFLSPFTTGPHAMRAL